MVGKDDKTAHREHCNICGEHLDLRNTRLIPVRCNVRKFAKEVFHVWRCRQCRCLHCWEIVDPAHYYRDYGTGRQQLGFVLRRAYARQLRRLRGLGLGPGHRLLDYGCGSGNLVTYLQSRGYGHAVGYDPFGGAEGLGDASVLQNGPFDFICLQDVIEHVEEPGPLIAKLAGLLREGGVLFVGMPHADDIDLNHTHKHLHHLHLPYHLHIYTREALLRLASEHALEPVACYNRFYLESPMFGMNEAFFRRYMERMDDTIDVLVEPVPTAIILGSPSLIFHGLFGYFYSPRHSITMAFRKPA